MFVRIFISTVAVSSKTRDNNVIVWNEIVNCHRNLQMTKNTCVALPVQLKCQATNKQKSMNVGQALESSAWDQLQYCWTSFINSGQSLMYFANVKAVANSADNFIDILIFMIFVIEPNTACLFICLNENDETRMRHNCRSLSVKTCFEESAQLTN